MKIFKLMAIALVAMFGFTACDNEPEHIYDDHSADLVGTWSCFTENYAEVLIINADGSAVSYGVEDGEYWENVRGTVTVKENNITMIFEDDDNFTGHFDIIPGQAFSLFEDTGERYTYQYCANDLADEIVGMWVSNNGPTDMDNEIQIRTYGKDGIVTTTGVRTIGGNAEWMLNEECKYKVVGDLIFKTRSKEVDGQLKVSHSAERFVYAPKATALGDIINVFFYLPMGDSYVESTVSFLHIKQNLDLNNKSYDYSNIYVTNVKGKDIPFEFAGQTLNFSTLDGSVMDKLMKYILFNVSFDAEKIYYNCYFNGENKSIDAPIEIKDNKVTIKMSANNSVYRDIEVYMFQDQDNTQMHMYMPVKSFENFFGNVTAVVLAKNGELNLDDADAVAEHYAKIEAAIETINLSFIFKSAK